MNLFIAKLQFQYLFFESRISYIYQFPRMNIFVPKSAPDKWHYGMLDLIVIVIIKEQW